MNKWIKKFLGTQTANHCNSTSSVSVQHHFCFDLHAHFECQDRKISSTWYLCLSASFSRLTFVHLYLPVSGIHYLFLQTVFLVSGYLSSVMLLFSKYNMHHNKTATSKLQNKQDDEKINNLREYRYNCLHCQWYTLMWHPYDWSWLGLQSKGLKFKCIYWSSF